MIRSALFCIVFVVLSLTGKAVDSLQTLRPGNDSLTIQVAVPADSSVQADTMASANVDSIKAQPPAATIRPRSQEIWVFITCCFIFFLAGINRRINEKRHDQSVLGFLNLNLLGQSTDRSFYEFNIHQLLGLIIHNFIIALWCFYFLKDTDYQFVHPNILFFILLFFLISIIYLCKFFFQYLLLNILQINDLPVLLIKCTIGLGYFTALFSLPLFMLTYYVQYQEWGPLLNMILVVILGIYLLFRLIKYLQLFAQFFDISIFYNILYFCGLELLPLLVFIKIGMGVF